jgi:hypothetical protein
MLRDSATDSICTCACWNDAQQGEHCCGDLRSASIAMAVPPLSNSSSHDHYSIAASISNDCPPTRDGHGWRCR